MLLVYWNSAMGAGVKDYGSGAVQKPADARREESEERSVLNMYSSTAATEQRSRCGFFNSPQGTTYLDIAK
jgi:hypothetical protein